MRRMAAMPAACSSRRDLQLTTPAPPLGRTARPPQEYMAGGSLKSLVQRQMLRNPTPLYSDAAALDMCLQVCALLLRRALLLCDLRRCCLACTAALAPVALRSTPVCPPAALASHLPSSHLKPPACAHT